MKEEKKSVAFYENGSWYHRTKELRSDGTVKYGKKGGFKSSAEAEKSYRSCENAFKKAVRGKELSGKNAQEVMFKEYLIYWFEEVFSKRIETTTRMITAYAVYDLILPKLKQDIKLKYLSADFLDELLGEIAAVTPSAGNKAREVLNIALKEAVSRLGERERQILALRFHDGRTQMEVAQQIGISQAQVSRLEKNALSSIRKAIC